MLEVVARLVLGGVLAGAASRSWRDPASSRAALATFGIDGRGPQAVAWALLIACELGLAAGVIAGSATAAYLAAALMATFAATMVGRDPPRPRRRALRLLRRPLDRRLGRAWPATRCSPPRSRRCRRCPRASCPPTSGSASGWSSRCSPAPGSAVAVLALAREVGMLRLRLGPASALEIAEEGPPLFAEHALIAPLRARPGGELALAVFVSDGCHVCRALEPSIRVLANDPRVAVASFEEVADAAVWAELEIPGQPVRGRARPRGHRAREGHVQQPRSARERARDRRAPPRRARARRGRRCLSPRARIGSAGRSTRSRATPRGAGSSPGPAAALTAVTAGGAGGEGGQARRGRGASTSAATPTPPAPVSTRPGLPRIDAHGYPLSAARRGAGRRPRPPGQRQGRAGRRPRQGAARPRRTAAAAGAADQGLRRDRARYGFEPHVDGSWYRCCGGHVRKLVDCCAHTQQRINGDAALEGYCYRGRKVFCVMYFQTKVPC